MDDSEDLVLALLEVAGGLLEEAASLAPLSDRARLAERIHTIESRITDAGRIVAVARAILEPQQIE